MSVKRRSRIGTIIKGIKDTLTVDEYFDTSGPVWMFGRSQGHGGKELRQRVDRHRLAGHAQIDIFLESEDMTPEEAQKAKRKWDERHGHRGGR